MAVFEFCGNTILIISPLEGMELTPKHRGVVQRIEMGARELLGLALYSKRAEAKHLAAADAFIER